MPRQDLNQNEFSQFNGIIFGAIYIICTSKAQTFAFAVAYLKTSLRS